MRGRRDQVQRMLDEELKRLKLLTGAGGELKVIWVPGVKRDLSGEVMNDTIYIYEENAESALETLRHEFVDYLVSRAIEPYRKAANQLIQLLNELAYKEKEEAVEALLKLADRSLSRKKISMTSV